MFAEPRYLPDLAMALIDPLTDPVPAEIPLQAAPLVRVLSQVKFPVVAGIEQREFVAGFQSAIGTRYPVLREEEPTHVVVRPAGMTQTKSKAWRFSDVEGRWRLSLTPSFLALETTAYVSRSDFLERWRDALVALQEHVGPALIDRLGVRYIDRIVGDAVHDLAKLVRPEVRGITGTPAATHADHSLTESLFVGEDLKLLARWGSLPAGATVDPSAIEPVNEVSWVLDLDVYADRSVGFSVDAVLQESERFAARVYAFFRWAVTDEFLRKYGGTP